MNAHPPIRHPRSASHNGGLSRRDWLRLAGAGVLGGSVSGWMEALADVAAKDPQRRKACILLWMSGGPSQIDTFDLKPGHPNGGESKEIATTVPGMRISQHFPKLAQFADQLALVRSMTSKEGDHGRATFLMRNGRLPGGPIQYPTLGSLVSKELGDERSELPNFVSISPFRVFNPAAFTSGFLGPKHAPLIVADGGGLAALVGDPKAQPTYDQALRVPDLTPPHVGKPQADARLNILGQLEKNFAADHPGMVVQSHAAAYDRAVRLMRTAAAEAFDLDKAGKAVRDAYGRNLFGQGCLLARRLVERGVPFVEVTLANVDGGRGGFGWDTHAQNFQTVKQLSQVLDAAWSALLTDLKDSGLLDSTLIVWMGEFGRTPKLSGGPGGGRDHFPTAFSTVLAGGGIKGGSIVGKTSRDGMEIANRPVTVPDFIATICKALGIDPTKQNMSNVGRPIRIADPAARPIAEILK